QRDSDGDATGDACDPNDIWRFGLYYTVFFGTYVAMSAWLPKYYVGVYGLSLAEAALLTTPFVFASSLMRPFGGWLSDRYGPRNMTYAVFITGSLVALVLLLPLGLTWFTICVI